MDSPSGIVYLVGAGPGDPGLLTLRGKECLEQADVVLYDALVNPRLLTHASRASCEFVGKRAGKTRTPQEEINQRLVDHAQAGKVVVRLKGGDPFVFGRGGEEAEVLAEQDIPFEVVPGITAGIAAPAYAGIPVTHRGVATSLSIITGHRDPTLGETTVDLSALAQEGTLVFYMGVGNLTRVVDELRRIGRDRATPMAVIERGTWPEQRTALGTLDTIVARCQQVGIEPPALIVAGEVARLRERLNWFESRPLYGLRVAVTRSQTHVSGLTAQLEALGASVFEFPTIDIGLVDSDEPASAFSDFDWIVLTSINGADALFARMDRLGQDARMLAGVRLCAIGSATAARLEQRFLHVDLMPERYDAEHTLSAIVEAAESLDGKRILLPRSDLAPGFLPDELRKRGAEVTEWIAYRTIPPEASPEMIAALVAWQPQVVTFTSGSTVRNFRGALSETELADIAAHADFAAIGPVTAKAVADAGLNTSIQPEQHDIPSLVAAIRDWHMARTNGSD